MRIKSYIAVLLPFEARPLSTPCKEPLAENSESLSLSNSASYEELRAALEKSYRNGNWRRLNRLERALYRAGLELARLRGRILNPSLLKALKKIMGKMLRGFTDMALELGRRKASEIKKIYRENGVFSWLPSLEKLLEEKNYLLWLGSREVLLKPFGL